MLFNFLTPMLIRHLWQLKTVAFLHWCLNALFYCHNDLKSDPTILIFTLDDQN